MGYDLEGARKAGISDQEILSTLAEKHNYDLDGAREAGISDNEILNTLATAKPPSEPVVEKESPELMGYLGAGAGAVGAAADIIYSKGRPLIRMAEKAMGMPVEAPPKPRTFLDPTAVTQQAIERRSIAPGAPGSAVETWAKTQHTGDFLGGAEYGEADKIKKAALEFEAKNPTQKVLPGSLLAVPEAEATRLAGQRAELAAAKDIQNQAEIQRLGQTRAERLGERSGLQHQLARKNIASGAGSIAIKVGAPILGGYELGSQGAQAYNRLARPDLTASDVGAGVTNVLGAGAGALSMLPSKYRIPAAIAAQGAAAVANWLDKRNPRNEEPEGHADGGTIRQVLKHAPGAALVGGLTIPEIMEALKLLKHGKIGEGVGSLAGTAANFIPGALGAVSLALTPSQLGDSSLYERPSVYEEGQTDILKGSRLPPGHAAGGQIEALAKKLFTPKETKILRASEALGPHEGKWLNTTQSDRMRSTQGDLGGPGFSRFQQTDPAYTGAAWGVGKPGTATAITNVNAKYPEGKAIWSPMIGSETQHHSNQHVFDALTNEFARQAGLGKLTPELRAEMNARLMQFPEYAKLFEKGINVANPESVKAMGDTFDRRGAIATVIGGKGVGGTKGQIFDYPSIMQQMTDPMTVGAPTHAVGTRLFNLSGEVEHRPDLHSAFPYILKGEDQGVAFNPIPKELAIPDWMNLVREFKGREPGYMDYTRGLKGKGTPNQFISENYLRSLEAAGHAAGGKVGAIKKLFEEAQAAYKAKFTPDFLHGSHSNKITAFDTQAERNPNFLTALEEESNDLAPRGFISLTKKPKFANDYATGKNATVYPVSANLGKHFDPRLPENYDVFHQYWKGNPESFPNYYGSAASLPKSFREAEWSVMEDPGFIQHLKDKGYNSMTMVENKQPNVGVFNPADIRGKFAKFNPEHAADPDFMKAAGGSVEGYDVGGKVVRSGLTELLQLIKNQGGASAAQRLERASDLVPNLEHQYQPQALKEAFSGNRSLVSVMNPADFEKYAAPISSETKSSLSKSRRIGEPGPGQDYTHMPLGTYDDYIKYLQQFPV